MCLKLYDEPHTDNRKQKMPLKPARCKITKKQITTSDSLQLRPSDFHHSVSIAASHLTGAASDWTWKTGRVQIPITCNSETVNSVSKMKMLSVISGCSPGGARLSIAGSPLLFGFALLVTEVVVNDWMVRLLPAHHLLDLHTWPQVRHQWDKPAA